MKSFTTFAAMASPLLAFRSSIESLIPQLMQSVQCRFFLGIVPPSISPPVVLSYNFRIARDPYAANVRLVLIIVCRSRRLEQPFRL
jgi:hypothetical protein